jgi:hypothetical protein
LLHRLEFLSSACVPQLIAGLVICEAALLAVSSHSLAMLVFLVQRSILTILLWPAVGLVLTRINALALGTIALVYCITEWRVLRAAKAGSECPGLLGNAPFRLLAASLGMLMVHGFVRAYSFDGLPPSITLVAVSLVFNGLLAILLGGGGLRAGLGVLMLADCGRLLYALSRPDALVWGLWNACDVLVALAASHLHSVQVIALEQRPEEACG